MKTDHLPALTHVQPSAGRTATLHLSSGRRVTVATADRVIFAPDMGVLTIHGKGYRVPASLFAAVRAALGLGPVGA